MPLLLIHSSTSGVLVMLLAFPRKGHCQLRIYEPANCLQWPGISQGSLKLRRPTDDFGFLVCCGVNLTKRYSMSHVQMRVYTGTDVRAELQASCKDFLLAAVGINRHKRVLLPKILHWYARDFSHDAQSLMEWISTQLPQEKKEALRQCLKKSGKRMRHHMTVLPYDWSFRYLFDRNIHDSLKWLSEG